MSVMIDADINAAESALGVRLPSFYRQLLASVGYGTHGDWEIYHPSEVRELYEPFFDDPNRLFAPYFPFGCHNRLQEMWIIDSRAERVASIWHETVPDDWGEEEWLTDEDWRKKYLGGA